MVGPHLICLLLPAAFFIFRKTKSLLPFGPVFAQSPPTMPLTEISPNVRSNGNLSLPSRAPSRGATSPKAPSSKAPISVQSMLRTRTELGDIGQFPARKSRLPRSGSRLQTTRRRSGSFDTSFASALRHQRSPPMRSSSRKMRVPRQAPSFSGISRQDTVRSNLTSYHNNPRSRVRGPRQYPYGLEGLTSRPPGLNGLYSHRSLATLRSQRNFSSMRSNSPLAYPARLPKPGYRAPSPAFSEAQSSMYRARDPYTGAASVHTAASSPVSVHRRTRGFTGYYSDMNNSVSSFVRLPSPAVHSAYMGPRRSPFPPRTDTPVSFTFNNPRRMPSGSLHTARGMHRSPTGSTTPLYYDYTESFAEEDCFDPNADAVMPSTTMNMNETILETRPPSVVRQAQSPFGTMPGSVFRPAELPTHHNRRASERCLRSIAERIPSRIPSRTSSLAISDKVRREGQAGDNVSSLAVPGQFLG